MDTSALFFADTLTTFVPLLRGIHPLSCARHWRFSPGNGLAFFFGGRTRDFHQKPACDTGEDAHQVWLGHCSTKLSFSWRGRHSLLGYFLPKAAQQSTIGEGFEHFLRTFWIEDLVVSQPFLDISQIGDDIGAKRPSISSQALNRLYQRTTFLNPIGNSRTTHPEVLRE